MPKFVPVLQSWLAFLPWIILPWPRLLARHRHLNHLPVVVVPEVEEVAMAASIQNPISLQMPEPMAPKAVAEASTVPILLWVGARVPWDPT